MAAEQLKLSAEAAFKGGCRLIQYRDKSADRQKRRSEAQQLKQLCCDYGALLIINDDIQLALDIGADGVHLGQGDESLQQARAQLGSDAIIGITCHNSLPFAQQAQADGADYVAFGRFFSSNTKPDAQAAPLTLLEQARAQINLPIVAIGGISRDNAQQVINHGADSIALSHGLFAADDIAAEAKHLVSLFNSPD